MADRDHRPRLSGSVYRQLHDRAGPDDTIDDVARAVLARDPNTQTVRNALDDLETAARYVEDEGASYEADVIRETVEILRDELEVRVDE